MGKDRDRRRRRSRRSLETDSSSSAPTPSCSDSESPEEKKPRSRRSRKSSRHREKRRHRTREEGATKSSGKGKRRQRKRSPSGDDSSSDDDDLVQLKDVQPEAVLCLILEKFPDVAHDLEQLLQLVDSGQGVDIKAVSDKSFVRLLKKLLLSLNLNENRKGVFSLPSMAVPTLKLIGDTLYSHMKFKEGHFTAVGSPNGQKISSFCQESTMNQEINDPGLTERKEREDSLVPHKRIIGPEMPSRELLAAAAELTRAEAELRDANLEVDNDLFIGPPPPALVAEVESTNEAERFEEVTRIVSTELNQPYDVLGINWKASFDNIKKRYWKLSLMVHPDKCSHPQAHQAFVILNQAFKDLQDSEKRKAVDDKIKLKEEQEAFQAELKVLREAAQWRRLQGISLQGDEELLAFPREEPKAKRDEWMTELPPERKPGMPVQSTSFSRSDKVGRGDTSMWTDNPLDKSRQAKQNYLEAYNKAKELAETHHQEKPQSSITADLVDNYNSKKRSKSLVQKHQEETQRKHKRKSKDIEREGWEGVHPWKPWDREKDLSAGRQKLSLDSESMVQGETRRRGRGILGVLYQMAGLHFDRRAAELHNRPSI
ncbi:uncharacterized protein LOC110020318 [Phalaenopsis equestris]|uniref:uncharacterized protein LOC110020318 n=1 Tax=Phalaenopsis equestris TaxID=78828 RepID=UPI0009E5E703|nr:uncharacterized protein LOC110020318 [Phalaenopsis equestris]